MFLCALIALYFFSKYKKIGKIWLYILIFILLAIATGTIDYLFDDAWWSKWILSPIITFVGFFYVFLWGNAKQAISIIDKKRLDYLFGDYKYRNKTIERIVAKYVNLCCIPQEMITPQEIVFSICTHPMYMQDVASYPLLLAESYIYASQGNYLMSVNAAKTLCKKIGIHNKKELLGRYKWITIDPKLNKELFDNEGTLILSFFDLY